MATYSYDAVLIFCGNVSKSQNDTRFVSSSYNDSDEFGMLGGRIRVDAAAWMYVYREANCFVFSTGSSQKTRSLYGFGVPTEAKIYSEEFKTYIHDLQTTQPQIAKLHKPEIILEEKSTNTRTNVQECFKLIRTYGWQKVAVISALWHMPRIEALCKLEQRTNPVDAELVYLSAEDVVRTLRPGDYDEEIDQAYKTPNALKRFESERHGLRDIENGIYAQGEYQLEPNYFKPADDDLPNQPK